MIELYVTEYVEPCRIQFL